MANIASNLKRMRADAKKRQKNHYQHKTAKTFAKKLRATTSPTDMLAGLSRLYSLYDKLAKNGVIHWKKSAREKARMATRIHGLQTNA